MSDKFVTKAFWQDVKQRAIRAFIIAVFAALPAIHLSNGGFDIEDIRHTGAVLFSAGAVAALTAVKGAVAGNVGDPSNADLKAKDDDGDES